MATSSSFSSSFPEADFRDGILNTMLMGISEDPAQRLQWVWRRDVTYAPDDPAGNPYDWTATPVTDVAGNATLTDTGTEQFLVVPYALEFSIRPGSSVSTPVGELDVSHLLITLIDSDYEKVKTADYARVGDVTYNIEFKAPPTGLFGVTVWQVYLAAQDQA
jgi:hypothetical protein